MPSGRSEGDLTVVAVGEPIVVDGRMRAEVDSEVAGEGPVRFLLQQSPAGRWRVLSIVARPAPPTKPPSCPSTDGPPVLDSRPGSHRLAHRMSMDCW